MGTQDIDDTLAKFFAANFSTEQVEQIADRFHLNGFFNFGPATRLFPDDIIDEVRDEVDRLIAEHKERRDLTLTTTGGTPRKMSVVKSEEIDRSELIRTIATSTVLLEFIGRVAREEIFPQVSDDERYLITHQEFKSDTHGWHWGDYSFALIWALRMPPLAYGGMLQAVPHTHWDKENPRINELLCERKIDTHGLVSGDIYLLRTDTTLHRTVPLTEDGAARTILNMTWAASRDLKKPLVGDDRWWENPEAKAAKAAEPS
jgi:L-lysine 4-chlorinase